MRTTVSMQTNLYTNVKRIINFQELYFLKIMPDRFLLCAFSSITKHHEAGLMRAVGILIGHKLHS